jgi:hypothetical protein
LGAGVSEQRAPVSPKEKQTGVSHGAPVSPEVEQIGRLGMDARGGVIPGNPPREPWHERQGVDSVRGEGVGDAAASGLGGGVSHSGAEEAVVQASTNQASNFLIFQRDMVENSSPAVAGGFLFGFTRRVSAAMVGREHSGPEVANRTLNPFYKHRRWDFCHCHPPHIVKPFSPNMRLQI